MKKLDSFSDRLVPPCPRCGSVRVKRMVYGLIDYEMFLELGPAVPDFELGWLREPENDWRCDACGHEWPEPH